MSIYPTSLMKTEVLREVMKMISERYPRFARTEEHFKRAVRSIDIDGPTFQALDRKLRKKTATTVPMSEDGDEVAESAGPRTPRLARSAAQGSSQALYAALPVTQEAQSDDDGDYQPDLDEDSVEATQQPGIGDAANAMMPTLPVAGLVQQTAAQQPGTTTMSAPPHPVDRRTTDSDVIDAADADVPKYDLPQHLKNKIEKAFAELPSGREGKLVSMVEDMHDHVELLRKEMNDRGARGHNEEVRRLIGVQHEVYQKFIAKMEDYVEDCKRMASLGFGTEP